MSSDSRYAAGAGWNAMNTPGHPTSRMQSGAAAETLAARLLESRGLKVLARNLRCRCGELDLVMRDGAVIVIVEVRQRTRADFGGAPASVIPAKQRRLIRAVRYFSLTRKEWRTSALRFDVVAVQAGPHGVSRVRWIKDAFRAT